MSNKDYYKTLGVSRTATADEIKKAYRRLAKKYHPDVSKEANAETRFKEAGEAYEVLKNKEKRAEYDQFGSAGAQRHQAPPGWGQQQAGNGGFGGFDFGGGGGNSSVFEDLFGGRGGGGFSPRKPQNQNADIHVELEDVYQGASKSIRIPSGSVQVKIPAGIEEGKKIRLSGKGSNGGDLLLRIKINPHKQFKLKGKDITVKIPISPWEAALGTKLTVPTLGGSVNLKIPANTQSGKKMRLKGRGLPGNPAGNQYIELQVHTPPANSEKETQLYETMKNTFSTWNPRKDFNS